MANSLVHKNGFASIIRYKICGDYLIPDIQFTYYVVSFY